MEMVGHGLSSSQEYFEERAIRLPKFRRVDSWNFEIMAWHSEAIRITASQIDIMAPRSRGAQKIFDSICV